MIKRFYRRFRYFLMAFIMAFSFFLCFLLKSETVSAYGETLNGYQTHYELQKQYISGDYLILEGFYFAYSFQNYTNSGATHSYCMELTNQYNNQTQIYYDTGAYYIDMTDIEFKLGNGWVTAGESDVAAPGQQGNYRYRDIGFQFAIPLSYLSSFVGESNTWTMTLSLVANNSVYGVPITFTQQNIYTSKDFTFFSWKGYQFNENAGLDQYQTFISADYAYVRSSPMKISGLENRILYSGSYIYWRQWETFLNMSTNAETGTYDKVTWYYFPYGNYNFPDGRWRVGYLAGSSNSGWIPSLFLGGVSGTPYSIRIINLPPVITAPVLNINEGTYVDSSLITSGSTAYDYSYGTTYSTSFGYKTPDVSSTTLTLNTDRNRVGAYTATFTATDSNLSTATKVRNINIVDVPPTITVPQKAWDEATVITDQMLLEGVSAYDPYDGDITSSVSIIDYGGLDEYMAKAKAGNYSVTYSVTDSNGTNTTNVATIVINNIPPTLTVQTEYEFLYGKKLTETKMLKAVVSAYDPYDGDITSSVYVSEYGGLVLESTANWHKLYNVKYSVIDSNGARTEAPCNFQITYKYLRSISLKYINTLDADSIWRKNPLYYNTLVDHMTRDSSDYTNCDQVWIFSNEDRVAIQKWMSEHPGAGREKIDWFLANYSDRKVWDKEWE